MRFVPLSEAETTTEQQQAQPKPLRFVPLDTAEIAPAPKAKFVPVSEALTPDDIRKQAEEDRKRYREQTGLAPSTTAPVEGTGGAAFGVFAVQGKQRRENIEARKAAQEPKISMDELTNRDDYFSIANQYMKAVGQPMFDEKKESRRDFIERFYSERRFADFNTVLGTIPELAALKNSNLDTQEAIALGRRMYEQAESAGAPGGPSALRATWDIVKSVATDPSTYLGLGAGKAVSTGVVRTGAKKLSEDVATRTLEKQALSKTAKRAEVGASALTETAVAGAADITAQRAERATAEIMGEEVPEYSATRTAIVSILGGTLSAAASAKATKAPTIRERGEIISDEITRRNITPANPTAPLTEAEQQISKALTTDFDDVHSQYVKAYGKALLNQLDPATAVTDAKVQEPYSRTAVRVALQLIKDNPTQYGFNPAKEQISDAVYRTLSQVDTIDDVALEAAVNKAGLRPDQFAAMMKTTVSEAAKTMQAYSAASRVVNRMRQIDSTFDQRMKELYSVDNDGVSALTKVGEGIQRVERESKALITSGIDTLARNLIGNNIALTIKTGVQMLEGLRYSVGTALSAADGTRVATLKTTMGDAFSDALGTFYYLRNRGLAEDVTEKVLENNPSLLSRISTATQDTEMENVSRLAKWSQTLNNAMDGMYRRASFASSLERELRRVGVDLYKDVLAQNKEIPASVLKRSMDEAFKDTFSYTPQMYAKSFSAFEDSFERVGAQFVRMAEAPGASLVIPFPRFVTNAIAFQYKYSPLGFIGATEYVTQAAKLRAAGQLDKAEMVAREGATKAIQATVGLGMLAAAYDYRVNNPDKPWYQLGDVDVRAIFPLSPYLGLADWLARDVAGGTGNAPTKEIAENIMGFKMPAGSQNSFLTTIQEMAGSEEKWDKVVEGLGKVAGDFMGRFTQPFVTKQIFDLIDLIRGDEAVMARDPNVLTAETAGGKAVEAAAQRVQAKLPVVKEELPPAIVRFKEQETPSKEGEFFNRIVGFRTIPNPTDAEKEINKHSTDLFKVYGRPSGDKDFDRAYISNVNDFAISFVNSAIRRPDYKEGTSEEKKMIIDNAIRAATERAKVKTEGQFAQDFPDKIDRIRYLRLSSEEKKIVNQRYAKDNNGRTMEEDKAYKQLPLYSDFGNVKFAMGGVVQQMQHLFGR
jgi:hypothetical protein